MNNLVWEYIDGKIKGKKRRELENDSNFMIEVLSITKDENYYYRASSKVKNDVNFISFLMDEFKKDIKFIRVVLENYLKTNYINDDNLELFAKAYVVCHIYEYGNIFIDIYKKLNDEGKKFYEILRLYGNKRYVMICMAMVYLENSFNAQWALELGANFRERFNDLKEFKKFGINNILLEFIEKSDVYLASYLKNNQGLLKKYEMLFEEILSLYGLFEDNKKNEVIKRVKELENDGVNVWALLYLVGKMKGITDFEEYKGQRMSSNNFMNVRYRELIEEIVDEIYFGKKKSNLNTEVIKLDFKK